MVSRASWSLQWTAWRFAIASCFVLSWSLSACARDRGQDVEANVTSESPASRQEGPKATEQPRDRYVYFRSLDRDTKTPIGVLKEHDAKAAGDYVKIWYGYRGDPIEITEYRDGAETWQVRSAFYKTGGVFLERFVVDDGRPDLLISEYLYDGKGGIEQEERWRADPAVHPDVWQGTPSRLTIPEDRVLREVARPPTIQEQAAACKGRLEVDEDEVRCVPGPGTHTPQ